MRFVEAELDDWGVRMLNPWSLVKSPEEFWGDVGRHGRLLLKSLLEDTMELWRDQFVEVQWHQPAEQRKAYRNGYYHRKRWPTALGMLQDVRVPRCREAGLTQSMLDRLEDHRQELGD